MPRLLQSLRIKARAHSKRESRPHLDIIRQRRDPPIVNLGLGKARAIEPVFARNLQPDVLPRLTIPNRLGPGLDVLVHLVVVARRKDADVVRRRDGGRVDVGLVADRGLVARDGGLLHVVARLGADEEALLAEDEVDVGHGALEQVEEGARV